MNTGEFDSVYRLILVAAERCGRIINGEEAKIQSLHLKPTCIALDEIKEGKVGVTFNNLEGETITIGPSPCTSSSE